MLILLSCLFFIIAFLYACAGMGGGSAYLATMALVGVPKTLLPAVALSCNTVVSSSSFFHYFKAGHLRWQNVVPFLAGSIPFAYIGGVLDISDTLFRLLLSLSLGVSGIVMLLKKESFQRKRTLEWRNAWWFALPIGALLGFLAGLIGIGGGVFLIPVLLFFGLANSKEAAAAGAFFILINSVAGLAGHATVGRIALDWLWPLLLVVFIGGVLGGWSGSIKFSPVRLQKTFGVIVLFVAVKLGRSLF